MSLPASWCTTPSGRPRARGAGIPFPGQPGEHNSITDVPGVEVGYTTLISGDGALVVGEGPIRTGVTALFPRGAALAPEPVFAGFFCMGGNGEATGAQIIVEQGRFEGPVTLTNTHSCGIARDATAQWLSRRVRDEDRPAPFWLPVAAETCDQLLNDINGHHLTREHVFAAFEDARTGPVDEGSVGGGTGMTSYQFKAGSGTASRQLRVGDNDYTVGAFVQANFGKRHLMAIAGIPMGHHFPLEQALPESRGSIIGVIATDAPLLPHALDRLARRAAFGIARSGGIASNESGDFFIAFSTANYPAVAQHKGIAILSSVTEGELSPFYQAAIEATDEAIINSMVASETMVGRDGNTAPGLPLARVQEILAYHRRLELP